MDTPSFILADYGIKPTRAHRDDAGYDIFTPSPVTIPVGGMAIVDTGVFTVMPLGKMFFHILPKSGLATEGLFVNGGVIDSGYTGSISVVLFNFGKDPIRFAVGDKIAQGVFMPYATTDDDDEFHHDQSGERKDKGFGSTGA